MPSIARNPRLAYAALFAGILCIGLSAIWVKLAAVPGTVSGFYRVVVAAVVLLPWWLLSRRALPARPVLLMTLLGGLFFALDLAMWNTALLISPAAQATLLANNAPLWVGLGAMLIFHERLPGLYWIGLTVALAGMTVVSQPASGGMVFDMGSLLAIGASLFYAAYLLSTQRIRARTDTLTFMTLSVLSSTAVLLVATQLTGSALTGYPPKAWAALLGLGLVSQLGGWLCINYALGHLPATRVSVSLLGQVLVTTLLAVPLFGEVPTLAQLVGGVLVLSGIYLVMRARAR